MTRLTEALRSEWLAMLLLVACLIGLGVLGVMAPDERLGQADRATHEPNPQAVSSLRVGIADAGEQ